MFTGLLRKTCMTWQKLDYLKSNPRRNLAFPIGTTSNADVSCA